MWAALPVRRCCAAATRLVRPALLSGALDTRCAPSRGGFTSAARAACLSVTPPHSSLPPRVRGGAGGGGRGAPAAVAAAAAASAAALAWLLADDAHAAAAGAPGVDPASRQGGFRSSRYASLPDMIEDVFPCLCKMVGTVGGRKLGGGSGFVASPDGLVVTNAHVFEAMAQAGAAELTAVFDDGRVFAVEHIASDAEADIAVGRLVAPPGTVFKALRVGSSAALRRGDLLAVLGAPLGGGLVPTVGVLSGVRYVADDEVMNHVLRSRSDWCLLQVDAAMSSGSSGGPIVNADGELVGVSVMVQTGAGPGTVGAVNYGVAVDQAWPVVQALAADGAVRRAVIGMTIVGVDALQAAREAAESGVALLPPPQPQPPAAGGRAGDSEGAAPFHTGLLVTYVVPGRPAAAAGLREGDVLLAINGRRLVRKGDYFAALGAVYHPGRQLECTVWRPAPPGSQGGGRLFTATVTPEARGGDGGGGGGNGGAGAPPLGRGGRPGRGWVFRG